MNKIDILIKELSNLELNNTSKDFLLTWEKSIDEINATILIAKFFKELHKNKCSFRTLDTGLAVSIFRDKSTRTRFSFASAANSLGLMVSDLDEEKSQIAHGETVRETANMISFMARVIGIRDDMFLGEGNKYMRQVGEALDLGFEEGTLHHRPGVINLQCDIDHPTQTLSDLSKLIDYFGSLENLKGKKIAMSWAYSPSYGKPLSVPQGIIGLMTRFGMDVTLAHPEGYDLIPDVVELAKSNAVESGGNFEIVNDMAAAFDYADVVYPKSWAPYHIMERRTDLLNSGNNLGLEKLEKECLANNRKFLSWECDSKKMKSTQNGNALYMHCLPADITGVSCDNGEVSAEVFEKYRIDTYHQASYKPFIIAAMMFLMVVDDPIRKLNELTF